MSKQTEGKTLALSDALKQAEEKFNRANEWAVVQWAQESGYVGQALRTNQHLAKCEPRSIQDAIVNVASIGISLSPAQKLAYLVPRGGKCVLDISYMGLIKLATDTGAIRWVQADLVYEGDQFEYYGPAQAPKHITDPFAHDRGQIKGVYCIAKTSDGDVLCTVMRLQEIEEVRACSMASSGPWKNFWGEMAKKTVIKRASKTWPKTDRTIRLDRAINVLNEHEGLATDPKHDGKVLVSEEEQTTLQAAIDQTGAKQAVVLRALGVQTLDQLPADQFDNAMQLIRSVKAA